MISAPALPSTDHLLASQISLHLAGSNRANLKRLAVDVREGAVTISGRVGSYYEKQMAIEACRLQADVSRLVDATEVVVCN